MSGAQPHVYRRSCIHHWENLDDAPLSVFLPDNAVAPAYRRLLESCPGRCTRGRPSVTQNRSATDQSGMTVLFTVGDLVMPARAPGRGDACRRSSAQYRTGTSHAVMRC